MEEQVLMQVRDLTKKFGNVRAVDGVSFDLHKGDLLGLIGPNGSGKTTLVNLITGFVRPDGGKITYKGKNITGLRPNKIALEGIIRTFQMVKPFYRLPAYKNLVIPLYSPRARMLKGGKYGDIDSVAIDLLEEVGFERDSSIPYKVAGSLPHGYLKRMELARCIALEPDLIIFDELFSGMSMSEVASTLPIIEKLMAEGKTMIVIEHRLKELFRIANKLIVLNYGKLIAHGPPEEVIADDEVKRAYLGSED
jgi:branched-chain amino acid transport system ATP-binding protein